MNQLIAERNTPFPINYEFESKEGTTVLFEVYGAWVLVYFEDERYMLPIQQFEYIRESVTKNGFNTEQILKFINAPSFFRREAREF